MNAAYLLTELRITLRNVRFVVFTLVMPIVLLLFWGRVAEGGRFGGVDAVAYMMVSMGLFGAMSAALSSGARIAVERSSGWNRLLRLTPLRPSVYVLSKGALAMLVALPALFAVYGIGAIVLHVHLGAGQWQRIGLASWLALVPFALLGTLIGYVATADTAQPITSTVFMVLGMLGGLWFPLDDAPEVIRRIAQVTPSYWLAELAHSPLTHAGFDWHAVTVLLAWTAGLGLLARRRYRVATARG